jgi:hypothetical protein
VRAAGLKLHTIVLKRSSLRRLAGDPDRELKLDYLRRDLLDSATRRGEFRYPRLRVAPWNNAAFPAIWQRAGA